jgi:hypothetical protein
MGGRLWIYVVSTASVICGVKPEHSRQTLWKSMKNLSRYTDILCELETSLLMRGIYIGEMSKLVWPIGLVNWAFHVGGFLVFSISAVTFNLKKSYHHPSLVSGPLHMHAGLILIFLEDPVRICACVHGAARLEVACFANVASVIFTGNDTLCLLLRMSLRPGFHEWTAECVFSFEDRPRVLNGWRLSQR